MVVVVIFFEKVTFGESLLVMESRTVEDGFGMCNGLFLFFLVHVRIPRVQGEMNFVHLW